MNKFFIILFIGLCFLVYNQNRKFALDRGHLNDTGESSIRLPSVSVDGSNHDLDQESTFKEIFIKNKKVTENKVIDVQKYPKVKILKELAAVELEKEFRSLDNEELKKILSDQYDDKFFEDYFEKFQGETVSNNEEIALANHILKEFTAKKILLERELEKVKEEL